MKASSFAAGFTSQTRMNGWPLRRYKKAYTTNRQTDGQTDGRLLCIHSCLVSGPCQGKIAAEKEVNQWKTIPVSPTCAVCSQSPARSRQPNLDRGPDYEPIRVTSSAFRSLSLYYVSLCRRRRRVHPGEQEILISLTRPPD